MSGLMDDPKDPTKFAVVVVLRGESPDNVQAYHTVADVQHRMERLIDEEFRGMKVAGMTVLIGEEAEMDREE